MVTNSSILAVAMGLGELLAPTPMGSGTTSFNFCVPPVRPSCIDKPSTYARADNEATCERTLNVFVREVFSYRKCVAAETDSAAKQANNALILFRCRSAHDTQC